MNIRIKLRSTHVRVRPIVVGTVSTLQGLRIISRMRRLPCDWVEVRFDLIGLAHFHETLRLLPGLRNKRTVLGTFRAAREGGGVKIPEHSRFEVIRRFVRSVDALDIEAFAMPKIAEILGRRRVTLVISSHHFKSTPPLSRLRAIVRKALKHPGAIAKIACRTSSPRDLRVLRSVLRKSPPGRVAVLGMGEYGALSRFWLPSQGSALTYGFLDRSAAPGQVAVEELAKFFQAR